MAPHFWYRVAVDCPGCPGECSVHAFFRFTAFDSGGRIALTCLVAEANLTVAPP
jgi:hypothetical protein